MNRTHKRRLLKLADFLATQVKPEKFDLTTFVNKVNEYGGCRVFTNPEDYTKCGTTACAVGWCPIVFPKTFKLNRKGNIALIARPRLCNFKAAKEYFGLKEGVIEYLFTHYSYREGHKGPKSVARRLREFVNSNGKVPERYDY
jgi:hypothetical protein